MSKFHNNKKILSFRQFDKLDGNSYIIYEFAWPVEVIECYANKVSDGVLDALAETTLELLNIPEMSRKKIAEYLLVEIEVINKIVVDLATKGYYDKKNKVLTEQGKEYLIKRETGEFQEEKVFGNMFVSRIDGEVFPYFHEGKLPWARELQDVLYLSYDGENPSFLTSDKADILERVNSSFHMYGQITRSSKEKKRDFKDRQIIEFIQEELRDRSFDEEETLAEIEETRNLKNARIKILNTPAREAYIRCRFCVSKAAPEKFMVDPPFPVNITSWYSECFHRMQTNNELIYVDNDDETGLLYFCENITKQFYVDFPEMQSTNFEQFVKIQFPKMLSCSISSVCLDKYKEVFNYNLLCNQSKIKRHTVITESAKAIELILNNYIHKTNKVEIIEKYKSTIRTVSDMQDIMTQFEIEDSSGAYVESIKSERGRIIHNQSIMTHFYRKDKDGHSIIEKYFFLIVEAYFNEQSKFRRLLLKEGNDFIKQMDFVNEKRNKFGAHNDGIRPPEISDEDYDTFKEYYKGITRILLDYID